MKKLIITTTFCFLLLSAFSIVAKAQNSKNKDIKRANESYDNFKYKEAIRYYEQGLKKDRKNSDAYAKLADCYKASGQYTKAEKYLRLAVKYNENDPKIRLLYAQVLMSNEKYEAASIEYAKFTNLKPADSRGYNFTDWCDNIEEYRKDSSKYVVTSMPFNSQWDELCPSFHNNGLVFTSNRIKLSGDHNFENTDYNYMDLFFVGSTNNHWGRPKHLAGKHNSKTNEGPAVFNKFGNIMYFTKNINKRAAKKQDGTYRLEIYTAKWINNKWVDIEPLPFNNPEYSVAHPALSADGKRLYFASDMKGGFGGTDIYVCEKRGNTWSKPQNLGKSVNTEGNESFPTVQDDGTLYYSSDGLGGFGGLDIFLAVELNGAWIVNNAGYPINSARNDYGLVLTEDKQQGYLTSERRGGRGGTDIYSVKIQEDKAKELIQIKSYQAKIHNVIINEEPTIFGNNSTINEQKIEQQAPAEKSNKQSVKQQRPKGVQEVKYRRPPYNIIVEGVATNAISKQPIHGAIIELKDINAGTSKRIYTFSNGEFRFSLQPNKQYKVSKISDQGEVEDSQFVSTMNVNTSKVYTTSLIGLESKATYKSNYITKTEEKDVTEAGLADAESTDTRPTNNTPLDYTNTNTNNKASSDVSNVEVAHLPSNMVFKVQIGAFSKPLSSNASLLRKAGRAVTMERSPRGLVRYVCQGFASYEEAEAFRKRMLRLGVKKAYVAAYQNNIRMEQDVKEVLQQYGYWRTK